jgi:hypothetical protein
MLRGWMLCGFRFLALRVVPSYFLLGLMAVHLWFAICFEWLCIPVIILVVPR